MKTLQQHIREANPKELADAYLHLLPFDCLAYQDSDLSVREILSRRKENVCLFIKELRESPSAEPNPDSIFLSFKTYEDGRSKLSVGLCYAKEVLLMKAPEFYAIDFIRMEEALGYLVADNRYTQANIVDTLAEILVELTFFGLHQEELEKAESSLKKALDELEAAPEEVT